MFMSDLAAKDLKDPDYIALPDLTDEEKLEMSFDRYKLYLIAQVRESPQPQFDDMGYLKYNETNEQADISYLAKRKNKMDTRMTSGITHEKDTSLLALLTNFNFEGKVCVFDEKNMPLYDLADALTAAVRKSRELENYDEKRPIFYRNMLVQGTSFFQERYIERWVPKKVLKNDVDYNHLDKVKWTDAGFEKVYDGCVTEMIDGKKVFLEDIRQQDIRKQPGVYTVEFVPREYMRSIWGATERWKSVPRKITAGITGLILANSTRYGDWTFAEVDQMKVEVVQAFRQFENRYQIYINGVPMLPAGFPLTAISPSGLVPISKGDLDPMNMFAYSKSIPAKTKIDQAVYDAVIRLMLIKLEQSAFPPTGNNTDQILNANIFMPGRMTPNVKAEDLSDLNPNKGINPADFSFVKLIKEAIDAKSISTLLEGNQGQQDLTLGQYMDMQKKQMLKLGGLFDAFINLEKQMLHLRTMNIISNWTKPIDTKMDAIRGQLTDIYRTITVEDTFDNGQKGLRVIQFTPDNYQGIRSSEDVHQQEIKYAQSQGQEIRYTYINPDMLKALKFSFYYEIVPVDKNNDKMTQAMFVAMITQAINLFGMESMNVDYLKKRYAYVMGEDFDSIFLSPQMQQLNQQKADLAAQAQATGNAPVPNNGAAGRGNAPVPSSINMPKQVVSNMFK